MPGTLFLLIHVNTLLCPRNIPGIYLEHILDTEKVGTYAAQISNPSCVYNQRLQNMAKPRVCEGMAYQGGAD